MSNAEAIKKAFAELPTLVVDFTPDSSEGNAIIAPVDGYEGTYFTIIGAGNQQNDLGKLFTLAVNSMPELLTTLEDLQRENERLQAEIERTERNRDMWKGQVERQAKQIEDFRSETKRLQVGVHVETLPRAHLIRVFAEDMNERNWDDKRLYIKQQAERITAALASAGEHHADK